MAYCTIAEVRAELPALTTNVMGDSAVTSRITRADAIINGKLGTRYSVPFTTTPPQVNDWSISITCYLIMRTLFSRDAKNKNDWIEDYKSAMRQIDDVVKGNAAILSSAGAELSRSEEAVTSSHQDYHTTFNMDDSEDQSIDSDMLDAIADEREA